MVLGFNWAKGPFEILADIGIKKFVEKDQTINPNKFIKDLYLKENDGSWYGIKQLYLPHNLHTARRGNSANFLSINENDSPSAQVLKCNAGKIVPWNDSCAGIRYRIVNFSTKANTLDDISMKALSIACNKTPAISKSSSLFSTKNCFHSFNIFFIFYHPVNKFLWNISN